MRKLIFAFLIIFTTTNIFAQEKGLHLFLGGNIGSTNFSYKLEGGNPKPDLGYGASIGAQYYFTEYLGLSLGVDLSVFNTHSFFDERKFMFPGMLDKDKDSCDLHVLLRDWNETQRTYFIDIPLLMRFKYKWGRKEMHGFYLALGAKLQIPVSTSYKKAVGEVKVHAHYPEWELDLGESGIELPWHGYGTNSDLAWSGKNQLKPTCAIHAEAGFLIGLSRRVDLTVGVLADYGFLNIKKSEENLVGLEQGRTPQDGEPGAIANYTGILNSNKTNMIHPVSIRATVGLRVKIGKLKEREDPEDQAKMLAEALSKMDRPRDTIIVNPVINMPFDSAWLDALKNLPRYAANPDDDPAAKPRRGAPVPQDVIDDLEESIYFALDKYDLDHIAIEVLDRKVAQMKKYPYVSVTLVGHTCDLGTNPHNDELSRNRSLAARFYMISKGVRPSRIEIAPMGKHYPTHPNDTEDSRRLNRRVDFRFNQDY